MTATAESCDLCQQPATEPHLLVMPDQSVVRACRVCVGTNREATLRAIRLNETEWQGHLGQLEPMVAQYRAALAGCRAIIEQIERLPI